MSSSERWDLEVTGETEPCGDFTVGSTHLGPRHLVHGTTI